jgi:ABC-2 type transport system permease protein
MLASVYAKSLRDLRRGFAWWSLGLVGLAAMMVSVYPSVRDNAALNKLVENYPQALKGFFGLTGQLDFTSAAGYLGTELFSFVVPLLLLIAAVAAGSNAIAGEEERGTLELLLSLPVSRRRVTLEKLAALATESVALGLVLWLGLWIGAKIAGMHISAAHLAAATASAVALAVAYGAIALLVGCATGRRGLAIAVSAAAAVAAYLVDSLAPLAHAANTLRPLSPFYHYGGVEALRHGLEPLHLLVLLGIAVVATAGAVVAVERRDLA